MLGKFLIGARIGSSALTIQTYSTPGTYSWTAPAGVTKVTRLTIRGGSGGTEWQNRFNYGAVVRTSTDCSGSVYGTSLDYSVAYNQGLAAINRINTITTSTGGQLIDPAVSGIRVYSYRWCPTTSNWRVISTASNGIGTFRRVGTATLFNSTPTSGTVPTPPSSVVVEYVNSGSLQQLADVSGGTSSALSNIAYGGFGSTPAEAAATYNNIAVVPGTTYTFTVGTNFSSATSFIEIEY